MSIIMLLLFDSMGKVIQKEKGVLWRFALDDIYVTISYQLNIQVLAIGFFSYGNAKSMYELTEQSVALQWIVFCIMGAISVLQH